MVDLEKRREEKGIVKKEGRKDRCHFSFFLVPLCVCVCVLFIYVPLCVRCCVVLCCAGGNTAEVAS